ncbi:uncharacterized protein LOC116666417 [Camelus ferus]|uniref:Uncharacterized protein LOC116666417 n=1 Tax=Camelus ferus TaxID=419612 RepID=A0A8B8TR73_CAMFR|nr:uncharacterized protein LOC116666417 [Camelus ferus]
MERRGCIPGTSSSQDQGFLGNEASFPRECGMYSTPILRLFEWTQWLNHPSKSLWGSMKQGGVLLPGKDKTPLTMESIPTISCSHSDIKVDGFRIKNPIFLLMTTYVDHCEGHGKMMEFKAALRCCSKEQADWKERNGKKSNPRRQGRPGSLRRLDGKDMSHGGNLACLEICQGSLACILNATRYYAKIMDVLNGYHEAILREDLTNSIASLMSTVTETLST